MAYFNHPFELENRMQLMDDLDLEITLSEDSLATDMDGVADLNAVKGKRNAKERKGQDPNKVPENDDDIFDFSLSISPNKAA